jgi:hypothetical protein
MDADTIDKYLKLEKSTALECVEYYCSDIIECFGLSSTRLMYFSI